MCGRFTLTASAEALATLFDLADAPDLPPRYNIAPTQPVLGVRLLPSEDAREFTLFRWGLIPFWAKDIAIGSRLINARSETAGEKPAFRAAFRRRRCLIPATGFYEWQKQGERKQPFYIQMESQQPFAIAGLWERWEGADGSVLDSCTLLTTTPNALVRQLHNRMPVILHPEDFDAWLHPDTRADRVQHLMRPMAAEEMTAFPVSTLVNSPAHDTPECVEPLPTTPTLF